MATVMPHYLQTPPKSFDTFSPRGGGAEGNVFLRFSIREQEEEDFILHWCRLRVPVGILTRDNNGSLVFRVSADDFPASPGSK
jgi:hypothetical protein